MATAGPNSTGTVVSDSTVGTEVWSNPSNATASDDSRATCTIGTGSGTIGEYLKCTNFGFSIPAGSTIDGITVEVEMSATQVNRVRDNAVRIVKGGTIGSTDKASGTGWPTSDTYRTYGGAADLWGETWTVSDINASTFGFAISPTATGAGTRDARVDHVRITIDYTAGGATYTMTADSGSFTLTGQTVGLLASRLLSALNGSFTHTGQDVGLLTSRLIAADSGAFTLTGQDAALTVSRLLAAASGAFTLAGQDVTLTYSGGSGPTYTLAADSGAFTLSGQTAALLASRLLSAETQSFTLAGQDAGLLISRVLSAGNGSFSLTGQDAALLASRVLAATSGAFDLTGQNVTLVYSGIQAPAERTTTIGAESRIFTIGAESRTETIDAETRVYVVNAEDHVYVILSEDRTLSIER